jgi:hypothetical protein
MIRPGLSAYGQMHMQLKAIDVMLRIHAFKFCQPAKANIRHRPRNITALLNLPRTPIA